MTGDWTVASKHFIKLTPQRITSNWTGLIRLKGSLDSLG